MLKLGSQPNGRSRLVDARRSFAHLGLSVDKAQGLAVEDYGGGVVGFRLAEEGSGGEATEMEAQAKAAKGSGGGRRRAPAG